MRIEHYVNTTPEEVAAKYFNVVIGVSLGNKYFSKENLHKYIEWALGVTKNRVLVFIGDTLQIPNLEVLNGKTPERALQIALKMGDEKLTEIQEILAELPGESRKKIEVLRWDDVTQGEIYQKNRNVLRDAFKNNPEFRDYIIQCMKDARKDRAETIERLNPVQLARLADYIIDELPFFTCGIVSPNTGEIYNLLPYPGISKINEIERGLQNRTIFPEVADRLTFIEKNATVDIWVD